MGDVKRSSSGRRVAALAAAVVAGLALLAASVVPPRTENAVVAVSRLGSQVRLLPGRLTLSFWPLEARVTLPRRGDDLVVLEATFEAFQPGRPPVPTRARLWVAGAGPLPLKAAAVRSAGLQEALGDWLGLELRHELEGVDLSRSGPLWSEIFPRSDSTTLPDVEPVLAPLLSGLELVRVELEPQPDPDLVRSAAAEDLSANVSERGRLVVLGLDALDWQLVDDLVDRGLMPTMKRLMSRGAHAVLEVPPPLISPLVWTTIATGVPPHVHGVLDFLETDAAGGPPRPVGSGARKVPALWEMSAACGRSTAVIGWWATFPAHAPTGCTVYSDRLTEQLLGLSADTPGVAAPRQAGALARRLLVRGDEITPETLAPYAAVSRAELAAAASDAEGWDDPVGGLARLVAATITVQRLTAHELERGTSVVLSYLEGTDTVGHLFGPYRPPPLDRVDPALARRFGKVVDRYYTSVDSWIGDVVEGLTSGDTLVIVSDHGFDWYDRPPVAAGAHTAVAV